MNAYRIAAILMTLIPTPARWAQKKIQDDIKAEDPLGLKLIKIKIRD